jgi:hypothetical protein
MAVPDPGQGGCCLAWRITNPVLAVLCTGVGVPCVSNVPPLLTKAAMWEQPHAPLRGPRAGCGRVVTLVGRPMALYSLAWGIPWVCFGGGADPIHA